MAIVLYNPYSKQNQTTIEGHVGAAFHFMLPYALFNPSGLQIASSSGEAPQRTARVINGVTRPDTFRKDASQCPVAA